MSNLVWRLEKEWSCPVHDHPVTFRWIYEEDWVDGSMICLDCLFGEWQVKKDADGWATMEVRTKSVWDRLQEEMIEDLRRDMNRPFYGDLKGEKVSIEWK